MAKVRIDKESVPHVKLNAKQSLTNLKWIESHFSVLSGSRRRMVNKYIQN